MEPTYSERMRAALRPQTDHEHTTVTYLATVAASQLGLIADMVERRVHTAVRGGRMALADEVLHGWQSDKIEAVNRMMLIASGGDEGQVAPASDTVADATQRAQEVAAAYDRGWSEGVEWARRQHAAGVDPQRWAES